MRKVRMKKLRITDFDICVGWGIYGPLSHWVFHIHGQPLSNVLRQWKRGLLCSTSWGITILGFLILFQLNTVSKTE